MSYTHAKIQCGEITRGRRRKLAAFKLPWKMVAQCTSSSPSISTANCFSQSAANPYPKPYLSKIQNKQITLSIPYLPIFVPENSVSLTSSYQIPKKII